MSAAAPAPSATLRPNYRDRWVQLLGVPLITAFGYYLTYNNIHLNWMTGYELLSDALKIFLVWQVVRGIIVGLDGRQPWGRGLLRRLAVQVPLTCLAGAAALTALVHLEYAFVRDYPLEHYWDFDLVIGLIFMLTVNVVYVGLYYYDQYRRNQALYQQAEADKAALNEQLQTATRTGEPAPAITGPEPVVEHLVVKLGRREVVVPYAEVRCCYSADKETYLLTLDERHYLLDLSLDRLTEQLPAALFFRANRQFLLTAKAVEQLQPEAHGKLAVQLTPSARLPERIVVSRDRAAAFRQWLRGRLDAAPAYDSSPK